ncbi:MAG: DTW domain-containing protein [Fuerstiella sp.]|nr:DTW domain-containing protein [Fuerstiella sp.]
MTYSTTPTSQPDNTSSVDVAGYRERCYVCYRPRAACFCDAIPSVDNRTHILILQHVKERFHAFNTARIVKQALRNSAMLVDQTANLAGATLPLNTSTGVLYPGPDAQLLSDLPISRRPAQLIILDGTWHHARTLMRDITALHGLPRYCLAPAAPSTYRIRKEPTESAVSTLEATVQALQILEPETQGIDLLLTAFDRMIDDQIKHPRQIGRLRRTTGPPRPTVNIPSAIVHDIDNVVVAYGEASFGARGKQQADQFPVYWVAQRLGTGESFECAIQPRQPVRAGFLQYLQLCEKDFEQSLSTEAFRKAWKDFVRPTDTLCVYNESTGRLLNRVDASPVPSVILKSINVHTGSRKLHNVIRSLKLTPPTVPQKGRAGTRLANAIAFARYLHQHPLAADSRSSLVSNQNLPLTCASGAHSL